MCMCEVARQHNIAEHVRRKYIETVLIHLGHVWVSLLSHVPEGKKEIDPAGFFLKLHFLSAQCFLDVQNIAKTI